MISNPTVLHAFPTWLPQTQTWIYSQVHALQTMGLDIQVACERTQNLDQFEVANIHDLASTSEWLAIWERRLRKFGIRPRSGHLYKTGQRIGAKIVHSHFGNIGWYNQPVVDQLGARHVVTFYGWDVNMLPRQPIWRRRYLDLFEKADLFLCEGSHMAQCLVALGCPTTKVRVQHLGVDIGKLTFKPRQWQPSEPLKILIAASFREKKGIPDAIDALGLLSKDTPLILTIIGDAGTDAQSRQEKQKILDALIRNSLTANTRLLGYQPHQVLLEEAYRHHVFLSPSLTARDGDTEGGAPVSLIEMAATGMPIVSTTHCDIPEVILHGATGLLATERDIGTLRDHLSWFAKHSEAWQGLLESGRQHIENEYSLSRQALKLATFYESMN